jgi:hypothetical protein
VQPLPQGASSAPIPDWVIDPIRIVHGTPCNADVAEVPKQLVDLVVLTMALRGVVQGRANGQVAGILDTVGLEAPNRDRTG